jgi:hypothetical protein
VDLELIEDVGEFDNRCVTAIDWALAKIEVEGKNKLFVRPGWVSGFCSSVNVPSV